MPHCAICHHFFVRPQSFETLFSLFKICVICETLLKRQPNLAVLPLDYNYLEMTTYHHGDHPALTHQFFHTIIREKTPSLYYQPEWEKHPEGFLILGKLFNPLKLFYHIPIEQTVMNILEKLEV